MPAAIPLQPRRTVVIRSWRRLAASPAIVALLVGLLAGPLAADSGRPVGKETYRSPSGALELEVDPRWDDRFTFNSPLLTLRHRGEVVWRRTADEFESFDYPMHALVADDSRHLVFGGYSVHNFGHYDEGLRFYDAAGRLIRYVSRRDLPPGEYSVSTAHWFDAERTVVRGQTLVFYTPGRDEPIEFDLRTGSATPAEAIVPGQGDDRANWRKRWGLQHDDQPPTD